MSLYIIGVILLAIVLVMLFVCAITPYLLKNSRAIYFKRPIYSSKVNLYYGSVNSVIDGDGGVRILVEEDGEAPAEFELKLANVVFLTSRSNIKNVIRELKERSKPNEMTTHYSVAATVDVSIWNTMLSNMKLDVMKTIIFRLVHNRSILIILSVLGITFTIYEKLNFLL